MKWPKTIFFNNNRTDKKFIKRKQNIIRKANTISIGPNFKINRKKPVQGTRDDIDVALNDFSLTYTLEDYIDEKN